MKKFLEISRKPLVIGIVASILYIIDALIGGLLVDGGSFMWVAFAVWTVFFGVSIKDRIKALIGIFVGYLCAILMMLITSSFTANLHTISLSCLLGVFVVNCGVMYFEHAGKLWLDSISGIFVGIMLTFSGLGKGLSPLASFGEAMTMLAIIAIYSVLGLICGYCSITFSQKPARPTLEK